MTEKEKTEKVAQIADSILSDMPIGDLKGVFAQLQVKGIESSVNATVNDAIGLAVVAAYVPTTALLYAGRADEASKFLDRSAEKVGAAFETGAKSFTEELVGDLRPEALEILVTELASDIVSKMALLLRVSYESKLTMMALRGTIPAEAAAEIREMLTLNVTTTVKSTVMSAVNNELTSKMMRFNKLFEEASK